MARHGTTNTHLPALFSLLSGHITFYYMPNNCTVWRILNLNTNYPLQIVIASRRTHRVLIPYSSMSCN